ncbi:MAG: LPS assembly protein LptD [Pelagimonas sp.]|jgi:LPS-assembly protein|nr:LPS assembly protein LptD [Pelagimonas sp.]
MKRSFSILAAVLASTFLTGGATLAQGRSDVVSAPAPQNEARPALLVADTVVVEADERLVASGHVEAMHGDYHLRASRVIYDSATETLQIDGPIRITHRNGDVIVADSAELDRELRNGLILGARAVLDQQLQLASVQARRVQGRYTELTKVAVTSCQVCDADKAPIWQIRATRVIHDQEERQLYFDNAQLRVLDMPVFYFPRLRLPDPTLKRARGFLFPRLRNTSQLGFGIKLPYFIPIGRHQDLTLTPYLAQHGQTLEFRYRRAFWNGDIELNGALSNDTLLKNRDELRGYLFANGTFDLRNRYKLQFSFNSVTDSSYSNDYGIGGGDRLHSYVGLTRADRDSLLDLDLSNYRSLRASEDEDTQPSHVASISAEQRLFPRFGGEFRLSAEGQAHQRWSHSPVDGPDTDTLPDGRDVARLNAELSWRNRWTIGPGLRVGASTHLWLDHYNTQQDATSDAHVSAVTPGVSLDFRLPMRAADANGGHTLLEPIVQFGWVGGERGKNPNDESTSVEFDEGNLLSLSRFPAADRREHGATIAGGLRWRHVSTQGWHSSVILARIWRDESDSNLSRSSGLKTAHSDWLVSGHFKTAEGLGISARGLIDDRTRLSKGEARVDWSTPKVDFGLSYLQLVQDPYENRSIDQSEWTLDSAYHINSHWTSTLNARYDAADGRLDRTGMGLQYQNECVQVNFNASRRFASASNLEPSTDFDLSVALKGFSTGGSAKENRRSCAN